MQKDYDINEIQKCSRVLWAAITAAGLSGHVLVSLAHLATEIYARFSSQNRSTGARQPLRHTTDSQLD